MLAGLRKRVVHDMPDSNEDINEALLKSCTGALGLLSDVHFNDPYRDMLLDAAKEKMHEAINVAEKGG